MNEQECIQRMIPPSQKRNGPPKGGIIQIWVTRNCDKCCFGCTQGSNLRGGTSDITPEQFEEACKSLQGYFGVVGMFGGNPCIHRQFKELCRIMRKWIPFERRGLWSNNLLGNGAECQMTFNPSVSNLNVHLDKEAYKEFKRDWPESRPFGLDEDSRHSPPYVAMKDVLKTKCFYCDGKGGIESESSLNVRKRPCSWCAGTGKIYDKEKAHELISNCDINQRWSAMIAPFRGELRGYFCEIAGAQSILHQNETDRYGQFTYPDTGVPIPCKRCKGSGVEPTYPDSYRCFGCKGRKWWENGMVYFRDQVRKHCHECGIPLRGKGQLAQAKDCPEHVEQVSKTHDGIYQSKRPSREMQVVTDLVQIEAQSLKLVTDYLGNARK